MRTLLGEQTYQVVDNPSNRFGFCGLVDIDQDLINAFEEAPWGAKYDLREDLSEDATRAIRVMQENGVGIPAFTGIVAFDDPETEDTYYLLTW